ncbi:MAG: hypothetical protein M1825_001536 [Sarcosagium campestre]|nr:MAG: hypothetical protein M1825_001536 [Sarcosagium campestre]
MNTAALHLLGSPQSRRLRERLYSSSSNRQAPNLGTLASTDSLAFGATAQSLLRALRRRGKRSNIHNSLQDMSNSLKPTKPVVLKSERSSSGGSPQSQRSRSRGRSSSPNKQDPNSPASARSRSELPTSKSPSQYDGDEKSALPACLLSSKSEISEKFQELEWQQRHRLLQSHLNPDPNHRWALEKDLDVTLRNRYLNVQPWANNRIHLDVPEGFCDYVNASPIVVKGAAGKVVQSYIATQGPKVGQFNHFWRMIWQQTTDPAVIVMLTQIAEGGREKCFQYFPESMEDDTLSISDQDEFGDGFQAHVKLVECYGDLASRSTVRKLLVTVGDECRTAWHLQFERWPDFTIPEREDRQALLDLIKLSREKNTSRGHPRVVHCSAGVGRSGTFIALEHLLEELENGSFDEISQDPDVDMILNTVNGLREQRMWMVQSEAQYQFIYQVLSEQWIERRRRQKSQDCDETGQEQASTSVKGAEKDLDAVDEEESSPPVNVTPSTL